jgi:gamma-glutamyltranspeptidase
LKLAETLKTVILEGGDALYTGSLAESFAADIQAMGGIITAQDMADFQ